ncbi:MAG TPA: type II toxin-antitoxin system PemK/MazF family toxin [Candidatus Nanoarchaeia archaeon]|nr:type II toxin-antitoxin system PemK/MazF family toxin [Candidatus Nanoarchaeia archaeon]
MNAKQRDLILAIYTFSDFAGQKFRPAIVVSGDEHNKTSLDIVAVPLTTNLDEKKFSFLLTQQNLETGKLIKESRVRVDKIFALEKSNIRLVIGKVKPDVHRKIVSEFNKLLR